MTTNAKWIVGLLIVLVLGLGIALVVATGGDSEDGSDDAAPIETVAPAPTSPTETTPTQTTPTETQPDSGGTQAP